MKKCLTNYFGNHFAIEGSNALLGTGGDDALVVAMPFAMKNGQICFLLQKLAAVSPALLNFQTRKVAERKLPEFFELSARILPPNFAPNFPRIFGGVSVLRFLGNGDKTKN